MGRNGFHRRSCVQKERLTRERILALGHVMQGRPGPNGRDATQYGVANTGRRITAAEKLPQLKRLKDVARSSQEVKQRLNELGGPTSTVEFQLVIATFSKLRDWRECAQLIRDLQRQRLPTDQAVLVCYSQAISACDKAKQWQTAVELLESMEPNGVPPNEFHYSGAISACAKCGQSSVAARLLGGMRKAGVKPNEVVYNTALSACER